MKETQRHFTVEVCDDHDGGSVWILDEDYMTDREEADELAVKRSRQRDNRLSRVRVNDSRVVAEFRDGEQVVTETVTAAKVCSTCQNQARPLPCPDCGPLLEARRAMFERRLLAYCLRGFKASGLVPNDDGRVPWEELDEETQRQWRALAAQVFYSVRSLGRMETGGIGSDAPVVRERVFLWEGSAQGFAESIARVLGLDELAALSGEVALAWRTKYHAIRSSKAEAEVDAAERRVFSKRPVHVCDDDCESPRCPVKREAGDG